MSHKPTAGSLSVRERGGADRNVTLYAVVFIINQFKLDLNGRQSARTHCIYCNLHYFPPPIFVLFIINDRSMSDINAWHVCKYICIIFSLGVWYIERGCSCDVHEILYASMQLWCVCVVCTKLYLVTVLRTETFCLKDVRGVFSCAATDRSMSYAGAVRSVFHRDFCDDITRYYIVYYEHNSINIYTHMYTCTQCAIYSKIL